MPRLTLPEPPYDAATATALEALGPPIALFRLLARRPERAEAIHGWGRYYLSRRAAMTLRHRELVILRTTARCGAEYEWGIHVATFAGKAELGDDQIRSLTAGHSGDPCWTEAGDRAVIDAVDALCDRHDLADEQWSRLVEHVGDEAAVDLLLVCGWYHAVCFVARAVRLVPEPGSAVFADYGCDPADDELPPLVPEDHHCPRCDVSYPDVTIDRVADTVRALPDRLRSAVRDIPDAVLRHRPDERTWSIVEYLAHLRDVYATFTIRLHRVRTEHRPALEPMFNDLRARRFRYHDGDPAAFLAELAGHSTGFREELDRTLDWDRTASRRPGELRTARWLARQAMHEGIHHLDDIRALAEVTA